jgi:hypothetical protein
MNKQNVDKRSTAIYCCRDLYGAIVIIQFFLGPEQVVWTNNTAQFRAFLTLPPAASPQGGPTTIILQPAGANDSKERVVSISFSYYASPAIVSVVPARATTDGRTTSADGKSVVVTLSNLPASAGPANLAVSFAPHGGKPETLCDGIACSIVQVRLL